MTLLALLVEASTALQRAYSAALDANDTEAARLIRDSQRTLNLTFRRVVPDRAEETCS